MLQIDNFVKYRRLFAFSATFAACAFFCSACQLHADEQISQASYAAPSENVSETNDASKIIQTAAKAPKSNTVSRSEAAIGSTKKSSKTSSSKLVDELEKLPNLNVRPDDEEHVEHKPHGAKLSGVMPGATTFEELKANPNFSKPVAEEVVDGYKVATYQDPTLPDTTIQIVGKDDVVEAIMINLNEPRSESDARKVFESEIKDVRPIWAPDEIGNYREVFPEKGVAFVLEAGETPGAPSNRVIQIVAETVKCEYFIMRAERDLLTSYTFARDDAEHALLHDPSAPGAHWILAKTHCSVGDYTNARKHIFKAIKLNDSLPQFHLTYIDVLIDCGEVDSALRYMDAVSDAFVEHPLFQIEGVVLDSVLRHELTEPDYDGSIAQGQRALNMLKTLYEANPSADVVLSAKALELRANLSIAIAVARKQWKNPSDQNKAFEWLEAATSIANEIDSKRSEDSQIPTAMIDVYRAGLQVGLEIPDAEQLDDYAQKMRASADVYLRKTVDEVSAASVRWRAGQALLDASRIYESRKDYKQAAINCAKALEYLETVTQYRPAIEQIQTILTELQLGNVLAAGLNNDSEAFGYLDKANETLSSIEGEVKPRDASALGGTLATVANMSWKKGKKDEAVDMMKRATGFLEKAYEAGLVDDAAMYVPYANLSTMCKGVKKMDDAAKYKKLAEKYSPKKS